MKTNSIEVIGHIGNKTYSKTIGNYNPKFHAEQVGTAMDHIKKEVKEDGLNPNEVTFDMI